jgi:putative membrane-bound dehydrogenase-like protein
VRGLNHYARNAVSGFLLNFVMVLITTWPVIAQEAAPKALSDMKTAEGIEVTLFAAENDLLNPTTIDVDKDGRVWVTEAVNYRLFNQPITEPAGDRIRVLEDTDGDGKCDKATTFYQDPTLQAPMGIAVLGKRVYVCQAPDLFYLEDTDNDGKADKRIVVLTGFEGVDHDHSIHGVMFGPDGLLYMSNGDRGLDVTDRSGNRTQVGKDRPHMAATVLRTDLEGNKLELLAEGMRNPYEPAVDCFGNVFISDNDDDGNEEVRINYVMEGGNYGYWPRRKGDRRLDAVHWNEDQPGVVPKMIRTGFGSPCGLLFYEGDLLPAQYKMTLFHADAGPAVIRSFPPIPNGAGYSSKIDVLLSCPNDSWFRPVDATAAPDGSVLVADWYDPGVGGHRMKDVKQGRIYRLAPPNTKYTMPKLDLESPQGIADALTSPNQARRFLAYQRSKDLIANGKASALQKLWKSDNEAHRARALWVLAADPKQGTDFLQQSVNDPNPDIRTQAVRILGRRGVVALRMADRIHSDPDPRVRRQLMLELGKYRDTDWVKPALIQLALSFDGKDRYYREAVGLAFKGDEKNAFTELSAACNNKWDERLANFAIQFHPGDAQTAALKVVDDSALDPALRALALDALDAVGAKMAGEKMVAMLTKETPKPLQKHALSLLLRDEGDRWKPVLSGAKIDAYLESAMDDPDLKDAAWNFVSETRRASFLSKTIEMASDTSSPAAARKQALSLAQRLAAQSKGDQKTAAVDALAALLADKDESVAAAALDSLYALKSAKSGEVVKASISNAALPKGVRNEAVRLLASNKSGCVQMLNMAEKGELPVDIKLEVTEAVHASPDDDVRMMADQILPREKTAGGQALPPLNELMAMTGNPEAGRKVFFDQDKAQCFKCHIINGEGKDVGPDLSKIGQKYGKDALFESILNPSAAISHEYQVSIIETNDFVSFSGFIKSETPEMIVIMDSAANAVEIKKSDIAERRISAASLMPTGLTVAMSAQDFADLVAYLAMLK